MELLSMSLSVLFGLAAMHFAGRNVSTRAIGAV